MVHFNPNWRSILSALSNRCSRRKTFVCIPSWLLFIIIISVVWFAVVYSFLILASSTSYIHVYPFQFSLFDILHSLILNSVLLNLSLSSFYDAKFLRSSARASRWKRDFASTVLAGYFCFGQSSTACWSISHKWLYTASFAACKAISFGYNPNFFEVFIIIVLFVASWLTCLPFDVVYACFWAHCSVLGYFAQFSRVLVHATQNKLDELF